MSKKPVGRVRIGFHVSIAGGLARAIPRAVERGCTALQLFCGNPRGWRLRARTDAELEAFRHARAATDLRPLAVHGCYLINPCSPDRTVLRRSISRLAAELKLSARMGADAYVLHPGSHKGRSVEWGIARAGRAVAEAIERAPNAPALLLEDTAAPHGPGGSFAALGRLVNRLAEAAPTAEVGIALDSCHAFGAGYDFRRPEEVDRLVRDVDNAMGLERLRLLHVNDARDEPGSRRDRHQHIGKGTIGTRGLRNLLTHPALAGLPLILETPWEGVAADRRNLRAVRRLLGGQAR